MKLKIGSLKWKQNWQTFTQIHHEKNVEALINTIRNEKDKTHLFFDKHVQPSVMPDSVSKKSKMLLLKPGII